MTESKYAEFMRISLKDRIKNDLGIDDSINIDYDTLVCDLVFKNAYCEHRPLTGEFECYIKIKHELDCNNNMISSMWDAAIKVNEQPLS